MSYMENEKIHASAWKQSTTALPTEARLPAPYVGKDGVAGTKAYGFCLPPAYAEHTLLPEVREQALALFAELEIPWHWRASCCRVNERSGGEFSLSGE